MTKDRSVLSMVWLAVLANVSSSARIRYLHDRSLARAARVLAVVQANHVRVACATDAFLESLEQAEALAKPQLTRLRRLHRWSIVHEDGVYGVVNRRLSTSIRTVRVVGAVAASLTLLSVLVAASTTHRVMAIVGATGFTLWLGTTWFLRVNHIIVVWPNWWFPAIRFWICNIALVIGIPTALGLLYAGTVRTYSVPISIGLGVAACVGLAARGCPPSG